MKKVFGVGITLVFLGIGSSAGQAGCLLSSIQGTWLVEGLGGGVAGHCRLIFNASGVLLSGSICRYDEPRTLASLTVNAKGTLSLTSGPECGYAGNLSITGSNASTARLKVRMSPSKDEIIASGPVTMSSVPFYEKDAAVQFSAFRRVN